MSSLPASVLSSLTLLDERSRLREYQDKYTKCSQGLPCLGHGRLPPRSTDGQWSPVLQFNTILIKSFALWVLCDGTICTKHYHFLSHFEMRGNATEI